MMKILVSGFTPLQIATDRRTISKIDVPASVVQALRESGHEVEWRRVVVGEDLSSYDALWICLAPLNSLNGRQGAMGALYALSSGVPAVGFFDDWQFPTVFNGARSLVKNPDTLYKHLLVGKDRGDEPATYYSREDAEAALARVRAANPEAKSYIERYYMLDKDDEIRPYAARLLQAASDMLAARWEAGMVPACPMYAWGDRSLVRKRMPKALGPIEPLDPTSTIYPILQSVTPSPPEAKERAWVLGALMPHDTWLAKKNLEWPVKIIGSRKLIRTLGGERLQTENDVLAFYNQHWGILSPPYPHAGSGWWRSRFVYSARVGSVLFADKGEGRPLGPSHAMSAREIENLSDAELADLARAQQDALRPYMPSYASFVAHCNHIVNRAVREDQGLKR